MERESDTITYSDRMTEENRQKGKTIMMEERLDIERENELMVRFGLTRLCARVVACRGDDGGSMGDRRNGTGGGTSAPGT